MNQSNDTNIKQGPIRSEILMYEKIPFRIETFVSNTFFKETPCICRKDDTIPVPLSHDSNNGSAHIYSSLVSSYAKGKLLNRY